MPILRAPVVAGETLLAYVEKTSQVSITGQFNDAATEIVSAGALTFDGATEIEISWFLPVFQAGASGTIMLQLYEDGNDLGQCDKNATVVPRVSVGSVRLTPSAGSHTYSINAYRTTANGNAGGGSGSFDMVAAHIKIVAV